MFVQGGRYGCSQLLLALLLPTLLLYIYEFARVQVEVRMQFMDLFHVDLLPFEYYVCFHNDLLPWELLPHRLTAAIVLRLLEEVGDI